MSIVAVLSDPVTHELTHVLCVVCECTLQHQRQLSSPWHSWDHHGIMYIVTTNQLWCVRESERATVG